MTLPEPRLLRWRSLVIPIKFLRARKGTWSPGRADRDIRLICLHASQGREVATGAEGLQSWSSGVNAPEASWHFAVDVDSITQSVELHDVAWHAGQINGFSVGIEQVGMSEQTAEQWDDRFSRGTLENVANLIALLCGIYDIPIVHCPNPRAPNASGVCTHYDVTKAYGVKGGHWDPGPNYPLARVLELAKGIQLQAVAT